MSPTDDCDAQLARYTRSREFVELIWWANAKTHIREFQFETDDAERIARWDTALVMAMGSIAAAAREYSARLRAITDATAAMAEANDNDALDAFDTDAAAASIIAPSDYTAAARDAAGELLALGGVDLLRWGVCHPTLDGFGRLILGAAVDHFLDGVA